MSNLRFRTPLESISPYVPGKPIDDVKREMGLERVIKLASNENPLGCSPLAKKAVMDLLENPALYPDGNCTELRNELSKIFGLAPNQFVFGAGSNEIISFIAQIFINAGDESIMPAPSFLWYEIAVTTMDGVVIEVPLKDHKHDLAAMKAKITDKTRVIWLCNPNNPSGTIFTTEELIGFLKDVPENIVVVLDEAYNEFVTDENYPQTIPLLESYPNLILLRTFSKVYGLASLRVGYAITSEEIAGYLNRVRPPFNVNTLAQAAALASLRDPDFKTRSHESNKSGKQFLYESFNRLGLDYIPTETNFIMVDVGMDGMEVFRKLLQKGVIIRFDKGFRMPHWIRVTIGTPEENEIFVQALEEVLAR